MGKNSLSVSNVDRKKQLPSSTSCLFLSATLESWPFDVNRAAHHRQEISRSPGISKDTEATTTGDRACPPAPAAYSGHADWGVAVTRSGT